MNIDKLIAAIPGQSAEQLAATRANAVRWLETGTEVQKAAAAQLIAAMDANRAAEGERLRDLSVAKRVAEAFRAMPMTDHERKVIQALLDNPGSTTSELNRAAGLGENMVWQMHFGVLCKSRQAHLWPPEAAEHRDGLFFSGILADIDRATNRFTLKPDVVVAFAELGLKATPK
jgi:hypothetical protein